MSLFNFGEFVLHSGQAHQFKIDCDALTDGDWDALVVPFRAILPVFGHVEAVARGGIPLAMRLGVHAVVYTDTLLICDDVLTTGTSMEEQRRGRDAIGAVVFARGPCPDWVTPLFTMASDP